MPKPLALAVADLHLTRQAWKSRPDILFDARAALEPLALMVQEQRPPYLFLLGDIFDDRPTPSPTDFYSLSWLVRRLRELSCTPLYLAGNHDPRDADQMHWCDLLGVESLHQAQLDLGGVRTYGLDYQKTAALLPALAQIPAGTDLFLCHQTWREIARTVVRAQASLTQVPHARLVISGDVHIHKEAHLSRPDGSTFVALSPGSTCLQSIDEDAVKRVFLINDDLTYDSLVLPSRRVLRERVFDKGALDRLAAAAALCPDTSHLPEAIRKPILAVEYDPTLTGVQEALKRSWAELAHIVLISRPQQPISQPVGPPSEDEVENAMRQAVTQAAQGNTALTDDFWRLEGAANPAREAQAILKERLT